MIKPPIIVLTFANAHEGPAGNLRNLAREETEIHRLLEPAERQGLCQLVIRENVTLEDITQIFSDPEYRDRIAIFHFAGHADTYALLLDEPFRKEQRLYGAGFAGYLSEQLKLQLVFLNGCLTAAQAELLHKMDIPAVISTSSEIDDEMAMQLAVHFYRSLAAGNQLGRAFRESMALIRGTYDPGSPRHPVARKRSGAEDNSPPWKLSFAPGHQSAENWSLPLAAGQLLFSLPLPKDLTLPNHPYPGKQAYSRGMAGVFWGRDRDILQLYKLLKGSHAARLVLLSGDSGVGKTSLLQAGLMPRLEDQYHVIIADRQWQPQLSTDPTSAPSLVILDQLGLPEQQLPDTLAKELSGNGNSIFLLSVRSSVAGNWEAELQNRGIDYHTYFLQRPDMAGMRTIVDGIRRQPGTSVVYGLDVEETLVLQLPALIAQDDRSPALPVLQHVLHSLFPGAGQQRVLDWTSFEAWSRQNPWGRFIHKRMEAIDTKAAASGLLLNMVESIINAPDGELTLRHWQDLYRGAGEHLAVCQTGLINERILTISWSGDRRQPILRIGHDLLVVPVLNEINRSRRPAQEALRVLRYEFLRNGQLEPAQQELIEQHQWLLPALSAAEKSFLDQNRRRLRILRRRRRMSFYIRALILVLLLAFGFLLEDPYLLLYLVLLVLLYHRNT